MNSRIHSLTLSDDNIKTFIRSYNQATMHKAVSFPFEDKIVPVKVARAFIVVVMSEKQIFGYFDDNGRFTETVNPQLN